jgi:hypothetical protein
MNTEKIIKEIIDNHSEAEVLAYCTSELVSKHNMVTRALGSKDYEKAAGVMGESTFALAILAALSESKSGNKKSVTVA